MRRLTYLAAAALALCSLLSQPLPAQSRGGGNNSRGGGRRPSTSQGSSSSRGNSSSSGGNSASASRSNGSSGRDKTYMVPQDNNKKQPARTGSNADGKRGQQRPQQPAAQPSRPQQPSAGRPGSQPRPGGSVNPGGQGRPSSPERPGASAPDRKDDRRPGNQVRPGDRPGMRPGHGVAPSGDRPGMRPGDGRPGRPGAVGRPPQGRPDERPGHGGAPAPGRPDVRPGGDWRPGQVPPPQRDPISYRRPSRFWDSGRHYFGYRVKRLPPRYSRRDFFGVPYFIVDDVFYRCLDGNYYVTRPPFGVAFRPSRFAASACRFAFYFAAYRSYREYNDFARYVTERNSLVASANSRLRFSSDNAQRAYESYLLADRLGLVQSYADASADYYYEDGVFFVRTSGGDYATVVPPAGAVVRELPDDYRTVVLDGVEYYAVDYTVYRAVALDGELYFEVLGQMTDGSWY